MTDREPPDEIRYYGPLIEFDSSDPEFVRGIEIGELIGKLDSLREAPVRDIIRRANEEMLRRVAHAFGRTYTVELFDEGGEFIIVTLEPPSMPNVMDALERPLE